MRVHCVEEVKRHQGVLLDVDYTPFDTVTLAKMARIKGLKLWSSQNCIRALSKDERVRALSKQHFSNLLPKLLGHVCLGKKGFFSCTLIQE
jgi:hypothetical protein